MSNIWGVLLQTLEVSLFALLLFLLGKLFTDKLSPRWQYGIWSLLALRILLPAGLFGCNLIAQLPICMEAIKSMAEEGLYSAYTAPYVPVRVSSIVPSITAVPVSVTDWLFVLYLAGVVFCLLKLLISYIRLRLLLRRGHAADAEQQAALADTCARYQLAPCRMVCIEGLPSAFVCGVLSPILAVPQDEVLDEKLLLHELLHKRYGDPLQSLLWSILRTLHWYNPFLRYIFRCIGNDMETLCDQRVLERLEGEARRDYGRILLAMTNTRYPRAPGTSCISNGAWQITRRIEAIVRFQKFPRGMTLVSICIALLLLPVLFGFRSSALPHNISFAEEGSALEYATNRAAARRLTLAMASGRQRACTSIAGAADTFAKALLLENPVYLSATTRDDAQAALMQSAKEGKLPISLPEEPTQLGDQPYSLYNLKAEGEDYSALLVFTAWQAPWNAEMGEQGLPTVYGLPIRFVYEKGWRVLPTGDFLRMKNSDQSYWGNMKNDTHHIASYEAYGADYHLRVDQWTVAMIERGRQGQPVPFFGTQSGFDRTAYPDAQFEQVYRREDINYRFTDTQAARARIQKGVGVTVKPLAGGQTVPTQGDLHMPLGDVGSSSSDGTRSASKTIDANWDGTLRAGGGSSGPMKDFALPWAYSANIYEDGVLVDSILLRKVEAE